MTSYLLTVLIQFNRVWNICFYLTNNSYSDICMLKTLFLIGVLLRLRWQPPFELYMLTGSCGGPEPWTRSFLKKTPPIKRLSLVSWHARVHLFSIKNYFRVCDVNRVLWKTIYCYLSFTKSWAKYLYGLPSHSSIVPFRKKSKRNVIVSRLFSRRFPWAQIDRRQSRVGSKGFVFSIEK